MVKVKPGAKCCGLNQTSTRLAFGKISLRPAYLLVRNQARNKLSGSKNHARSKLASGKNHAKSRLSDDKSQAKSRLSDGKNQAKISLSDGKIKPGALFLLVKSCLYQPVWC